MEIPDKQINAVAHELARMYASGWSTHGELIGEQKNYITPKEWADCNFHMFTTEAVELIYKIYGAQEST